MLKYKLWQMFYNPVWSRHDWHWSFHQYETIDPRRLIFIYKDHLILLPTHIDNEKLNYVLQNPPKSNCASQTKQPGSMWLKPFTIQHTVGYFISMTCLPTNLLATHDDVIKWKHFPRYWPFVGGDSPVTGEFPLQRPVTPNFDVFFDLCLNK